MRLIKKIENKREATKIGLFILAAAIAGTCYGLSLARHIQSSYESALYEMVADTEYCPDFCTSMGEESIQLTK